MIFKQFFKSLIVAVLISAVVSLLPGLFDIRDSAAIVPETCLSEIAVNRDIDDSL